MQDNGYMTVFGLIALITLFLVSEWLKTEREQVEERQEDGIELLDEYRARRLIDSVEGLDEMLEGLGR